MTACLGPCGEDGKTLSPCPNLWRLMMAINIINLYHYSKKPRPPNVVYCGRSNEYNPLGNPYPMKGKDDRDEVCDQYEDLINFKCPPDTREAIHGLRDRYARTG